ncbi:MAG: phage holin family protein [Dehalococcoidia bacterium]
MEGAREFRQGQGENIPEQEWPGQEPAGGRLRDDLRRGRREAEGLGNEIADVASDLGTLLQQEVQLAKAEIREQAGKGVQSLVSIATAGIFAALMLVFLFVGVMLVIGEALELWVSAFITAGILLVLAAIGALIARQRIKQMNPVPERTIESVKEDLEWARSQIRSGTR